MTLSFVDASSLPMTPTLDQAITNLDTPTQSADVQVQVQKNATTVDSGVDHNGIPVGHWKIGIYECMHNGLRDVLMASCCSGLVIALIAARVGLMNFYVVLALFSIPFSLFIATIATQNIVFLEVSLVVGIIVLFSCVRLRWRIRQLFSIPESPFQDLFYTTCCGCCSIAQMAYHVDAYEPGTFAYSPKDTLPGYEVEV